MLIEENLPNSWKLICERTTNMSSFLQVLFRKFQYTDNAHQRVFFLTALLTITRIMNKINNREEMKYMCKVIRSDQVKRAGANGTRGPMRGTAHYIKKNQDTNNN